MSMMRALALMGTGAEGFVKGQRDEEAAQRTRDQDAFQKTQQQFTLGEQQRVMQQRAEMAAAVNDPAASDPAQPVPAAPQPAPSPGGADASCHDPTGGGRACGEHWTTRRNGRLGAGQGTRGHRHGAYQTDGLRQLAAQERPARVRCRAEGTQRRQDRRGSGNSRVLSGTGREPR